MKLPIAERQRQQTLANLHSMVRQRNISERNIKTLNSLCNDPDQEIRECAKLILEMAKIKPGKKKRIGVLARRDPDLLRRLQQHGLIDDFLYPFEDDWCEHPQFYDFPLYGEDALLLVNSGIHRGWRFYFEDEIYDSASDLRDLDEATGRPCDSIEDSPDLDLPF